MKNVFRKLSSKSFSLRGKSHSAENTRSGQLLQKSRAGTGLTRRHIQGSKIAEGLPSVNLQYWKIEKPKKWTEWRAKEKKILEKKSHNAEKLKGGPFGVFQHPFCLKTSKNGGGKIFILGKKSHDAEKN